MSRKVHTNNTQNFLEQLESLSLSPSPTHLVRKQASKQTHGKLAEVEDARARATFNNRAISLISF
jgi:hypothetical protein